MVIARYPVAEYACTRLVYRIPINHVPYIIHPRISYVIIISSISISISIISTICFIMISSSSLSSSSSSSMTIIVVCKIPVNASPEAGWRLESIASLAYV